MAPMTIQAAVDGSALGNPGPAGWAWVVSPICWDAGGWDHGTNNLGELTAILELLRATENAGLADEPLHILADSQYAINVITKWMHGWKKKGWAKADKKPIANLEVIQEIDQLIAGRQVTFEWVRGHAGHPMNERADDLARGAAEIHQKGGLAQGGPGFTKASSNPDFPDSLTSHAIDDSEPAGIAPSPRSVAPASDGDTRVSLSGAHVCPHDDSPLPQAAVAVDAQPGTEDDAATAAPLPPLTRSDVLAAQKAIITAWTSAKPDDVATWLAPGFERVWPNGAVSEDFYGPCPAHLSVSRIHTRMAGNIMLTRFHLTWSTGTSVETGTWIPTAEGPRLIHHQSTIKAPSSGTPNDTN